MEEEQCSNHQGAHNIQERQFIDNIGEEKCGNYWIHCTAQERNHKSALGG